MPSLVQRSGVYIERIFLCLQGLIESLRSRAGMRTESTLQGNVDVRGWGEWEFELRRRTV